MEGKKVCIKESMSSDLTRFPSGLAGIGQEAAHPPEQEDQWLHKSGVQTATRGWSEASSTWYNVTVLTCPCSFSDCPICFCSLGQAVLSFNKH